MSKPRFCFENEEKLENCRISGYAILNSLETTDNFRISENFAKNGIGIENLTCKLEQMNELQNQIQEYKNFCLTLLFSITKNAT